MRAAVQRYGSQAALYVVGSCVEPVSPLELVVDDIAHPMRVLIPPHHLGELDDDAASCGFRAAVMVDAAATEVLASLIGRGQDHFAHDLGCLPVPQAACKPDLIALVPLPDRRCPPQSRRRNVLLAPHMEGTGGAQWWLGEVHEALERADWAITDSLQPTRVAGGALGLIIAQDDYTFEEAVGWRTAELVKREPDVVLINTIEGLATAEACRRQDVPFCWAIHESYAPPVLWASVFEFAVPSPRAVDALERCLAAAKIVMFVSEETRALFASYVLRDRSRVVPFRASRRAVARTTSGNDRRLWGIPTDAFLVVTVSTLEERKNPGLLVVAMARARRSIPNLYLVLAGPGPSAYEDWLTSLAKHERLAGAFTIVRRHVETQDLLELADLYVSASDIESRSVVLLEAMAAGVPIVATRACGVTELIDDGIDGVLCPLGDPDALASAVVALADAPDLRSDLACRASARVAAIPNDWADEVVESVAAAAQP